MMCLYLQFLDTGSLGTPLAYLISSLAVLECPFHSGLAAVLGPVTAVLVLEFCHMHRPEHAAGQGCHQNIYASGSLPLGHVLMRAGLQVSAGLYLVFL